MVKSTNVVKQVYQGYNVLRCYYRLVKILSNKKILLGKIAQN